jgi:hypothetical protein
MIFRITEGTSSFLAQRSFDEDYFLSFFSPMLYATSKGLEMKAPFSNILQNQTNDVMVNPRNLENHYSNKLAAARIIST